MKFETNTSPVEISGAVSAPTVFNIASSRQAFTILSSRLYTNKIRAIIRELSCNAWDAHVAAGKTEVPFKLHLPTSFEPFFSVKDEGTGLEYVVGGCDDCKGSGKVTVESAQKGCSSCEGTGDYDAVRELYCTYFASNKSNSNLFIGALGLGSKSPFCYTEGFSVTNTFAGKTRVYSCFLNQDGMPAVLLQEVNDTPDVANGVEIQFPVKQNDVFEFTNQAEHVLEFFDPLPEINVSRIRIHKEEYTFLNEKWGLRKDSNETGVRAIQGKVQYTIGDIDLSRVTPQQKKMLTMDLDLFFPIGELSVAASRESLSNDEKTIVNILKAIDIVQEGLLKEAETTIAACETPWEARLKIFSLSNQADIGALVSRAFADGKFNSLNPSFNLEDSSLTINFLDYKDVAIFEMSHSWRNKLQARKERMTPVEIPLNATEVPINFRKPSGRDDDGNEKEAVVINDVGVGVEKYVNYLVQNSEDSIQRAYFITMPSRTTPIDVVVDQALSIVEKLGKPPLVFVSQLKDRFKEVFTEASEKPKPPRKVLEFKEWYHPKKDEKGWRNAWDEVKGEDLPSGVKYYVPVKNLEPQTGQYESVSELSGILSTAVNNKEWSITEKEKLYGIPFWRVKDLDNTWVEFSSYVMDRYKQFMTPQREMQMSLQKHRFSTRFDTIMVALSKTTVLAQDSPFIEFCKAFAVAYRYRTTAINIQPVVVKAEKLGIHTIKNTVDFNPLWEKVKKQYPLLDFIRDVHWDPTALTQHLQQYIGFIDNETKKPEEPVTYAVAPLLPDQTEEHPYAN